MIKKILLFFFIFLLSFQVIIDTDFGWHLRAGEYIINNRSVPKTDIFSFSQPNYRYVYHSWGAEVLIYLSYLWYGLYGVSALYAAILTISIFFLYETVLLFKKEPNPIFFLGLTLLAHAVAGGRTRIFGFLILTILYYFFIKFQKQKSKLIFLTPLLFTLWVNLHASFILGIFTLIILLTAYTIQRKRFDKKILALLPLSIIATLINPYFLNAIRQAIQMSLNSYGINAINTDWQSLISTNTVGWIIAVLVTITVIVAQLSKVKIDNLTKFLTVIFFLLSIVSNRFAIALIVFFTPLASNTIIYFQKKQRKQILRAIPIKASVFAIKLVILLLVLKNLFAVNYAYKSLKNYSVYLNNIAPTRLLDLAWPYQANLYVTENLKTRRVLNYPNWSGFMFLLDKNVRVFYWGAMDNFIINNQSFAITTLNIIDAKPGFSTELEKYQINAVFLPSKNPLIGVLKQKSNWQTVYEDNQAVVMTKN